MTSVILFEAKLLPSERRLRGRTRLIEDAVALLRRAYDANVLQHEADTLCVKLEVLLETESK